MLQLITIIKSQLRQNEKIFILREAEVNEAIGMMHKYTTKEELFKDYDKKEKVKRYWHEDGLCIILK